MAFRNSQYYSGAPMAPSEEIIPGMELDRSGIQRESANTKPMLLMCMGIDADQGGFNRDEKGNLRIFEMTPDGKIADPLADDRVDSAAFLEKIQQGRIFAFPAGENDPVQMKIVKGDMKVTEPVGESPFPRPKVPSPWMRFIHIFGGYKKEFAEYDAAKAKWDASREALKQMREARSPILKSEQESYEAEEALREAERKHQEEVREQEKLVSLQGTPEQYKGANEKMMDYIQEIYGTKPVLHDEFAGKRYSLEQFAHLKRYEISELDVAGPITERQFMSLGVISAMEPEHGGMVRLKEGVDPELNAMSNNTFYIADLARRGLLNPRENCGDYFEKAQGPGRDAAVQAIRAYQQGDPKPLGSLIGRGIHRSAIWQEHGSAEHRDFLAVNGIVGIATQLLDRDPRLMEAARGAGMTESELATARGDVKLAEIANKNEWAAERLAAETAGKLKLTDEQRRECVEARLSFEVINREIDTDLAEREKSDACTEVVVDSVTRINARAALLKKEYLRLEKEEREGRITKEEHTRLAGEAKKASEEECDQINARAVPLRVAAAGMPEVYALIGGPRSAEVISGLVQSHFPGRDKLFALKGAELENALKPNALFAEKSPFRVPSPPEKGPEPVPQAEREQAAAKQEAAKQEAGPEAGM